MEPRLLLVLAGAGACFQHLGTAELQDLGTSGLQDIGTAETAGLAELEREHGLSESEYTYGVMRGRFGQSPWLGGSGAPSRNISLGRSGRKLGASKGSRLWPGAVVPYQFAETIDYKEWQTMQLVFKNISSVTNIQFIPRKAKDTDYLLVTEDMKKYGCGCCSIGLGHLAGSGPHVLVLGPVSEGGCGVNHIGGMHELLHILGLAHTQNRPDRCNYIDVRTDLLTGWGEWRVGQVTGAADWFELRVPYDCSSYVHYYQLQGAFWKKGIEKQVDGFMEKEGCESAQRGQFVNSCLVEGGHTKGTRVVKEGYEKCVAAWERKHKGCVASVIRRFPTFQPVDPNGKCKANGINKEKRKSWEISQYDIWALNAAYGGPLPPCQRPGKVGDGVCDRGNNNLGCGYDGGDCCLPGAKDKDCIDPCGVRLKFYGGRNRPCRKAPVTKEFCADHYWYGPNKCSPEYCRQADQKFLQWQCKKTCNLCNTDPDQKEMDEICNSFLGPEIRRKYATGKPNKTKHGKKIEKKVAKHAKKSFLKEVPRSQSDPGTEKCGINNALICRRTSPVPTTPLTTPSPRKFSITTKPSPRPAIKPNTTPSVRKIFFPTKPSSKSAFKPIPTKTFPSKSSTKKSKQKFRSSSQVKPSRRRPSKTKSKPARQNQVSHRSRGKNGTSRSSQGFVVASAAKRKQFRSYWMRRG